MVPFYLEGDTPLIDCQNGLLNYGEEGEEGGPR